MSSQKIPQEKKDREAAFVKERFEAMQLIEPDLTQEVLAAEVGRTQGLIGQWLSGVTHIPDKQLMYLGGRLRFDALELRPSLRDYLLSGFAVSGRDKILGDLIKRLTEAGDSEFRALSRMISAYLDEPDNQK
ncbi:MAG TPA: hypothetical protein VIZ65_00305 [Cellvibrionaceae bacterium]